MTQPRHLILLAEDDPDDRLLVQDALVEGGLSATLLAVSDGEELLELLHSRGPHAGLNVTAGPCVILLDLNMPRKDGRTVLREIKSDPNLRHIPIVVLTTSNAEEDIRHAYDTGVNSFIIKPSTFAGMVAIVQTLNQYWFETARLPAQPL